MRISASWALKLVALILILRAVQLLLGHTKLESKVGNSGIEVDGALEIAVQTEICFVGYA